MSELLISVDLGTTRLKVAAFGLDGTLAHLVVRRHADHERVGSEGPRRWQHAEGWWLDTAAAVRELLAALPGSTVLGIGLSGRGGAAVFADSRGEIVADPWMDNRHAGQVRELVAWRAGGAWLSNYGLQLIAKYLWLKEAHPEATADVCYGFYAKDWLLYRLTGEHLTDWTSGPDAPGWDSRLEELDLPEALLPPPRLPWQLAGTLTREAAAALGLGTRVPVAVGAHDGLAANIGAGAIEHGEFAVTLGTHAVVRAVQDAHAPGAYRFYGFPPDRHIIGGNAVLGGRTADWFLELVSPRPPGDARAQAFSELESLAAGAPPGAGGARFLPFLSGQVAPESRPDARAVFAGLELGHGRGELYRAVLEGSSFAVKQIFDQVSGWCGTPTRLRATGGGAESVLWMDILASILDQPIELTGPAAEARGAAMCLAVALGIYDDLGDARNAMVHVTRVAEPRPAWMNLYADVFRNWSRLNEFSRDIDGFSRDPGPSTRSV